MYLALHDAGMESDLEAVAKILVILARKHRRGSASLGHAEAVVEVIRRDRAGARKHKNAHGIEKVLSARPLYMIMQYVSQAFDETGFPAQFPGGGESLVCTMIRRRVPLAPEGFRKVGNMTGNPKQPPEDSDRCWPNKTTLTSFGKDDSESLSSIEFVL